MGPCRISLPFPEGRRGLGLGQLTHLVSLVFPLLSSPALQEKKGDLERRGEAKQLLFFSKEATAYWQGEFKVILIYIK